MEFLIGLVIAGVVAFFVVQDANALRDEEIAVLGSSTISPGLWGAGVFLVAIIFLPVYIIFRISRGGQITRARIDGATRPTVTAPAPKPPQQQVSSLDEIARAHELMTQGVITEQEYEAIKARVLQ